VPHAGGRPPGKKNTRVTPEQVAIYAGAMCTQGEVARILGITPQSMSTMLQKPAYRAAWERAQDNTRYLLRKAQIENALSGKTVDLIWVGKQYLEQRDSVHQVEQNTNVEIRYVAEWGGGGALPAAPEQDTIEGEVEEET